MKLSEYNVHGKTVFLQHLKISNTCFIYGCTTFLNVSIFVFFLIFFQYKMFFIGQFSDHSQSTSLQQRDEKQQFTLWFKYFVLLAKKIIKLVSNLVIRVHNGCMSQAQKPLHCPLDFKQSWPRVWHCSVKCQAHVIMRLLRTQRANDALILFVFIIRLIYLVIQELPP